MADKWTAIHTFWNSFGLIAYDENTVPDGAVFPYITYNATIAEFDQKTPITASLWYRAMNWSDISQKASEIADFITGGAGVPYDGGRLWITPGFPFAQRMAEPSDDKVRRIVLQVAIEFQ